MISNILLPLDFSSYTDSALQYACFVAKRQEATITGTAVLIEPGIQKCFGPAYAKMPSWTEKLDKRVLEQINQRITKVLDKFNKTCEAEGVAHETTEFQGTCTEQIMFQSMFYDLLVMGFRSSYYFDELENVEMPLEKILSHTITPILAVPKNFIPIRKALIAFDGSLPAARAMKCFANISRDKEVEFIILMSHPEQDTAMYYLNKAKEYMKAHGQPIIKTEWTSRNIITEIKEKYMDEVDMFIAGVHSKDALKSFFLGSLIKYLLREAKKPLFIGQ
ncbi:MAG: universal stress protein [Pseudomonadota bacterium]